MVDTVWSTLTNYSQWQVTEYFYEQKGNNLNGLLSLTLAEWNGHTLSGE